MHTPSSFFIWDLLKFSYLCSTNPIIMKNRSFLLPHIFGKIGWFILVPFTILGLFIMFTGGKDVNLGRFFSATYFYILLAREV